MAHAYLWMSCSEWGGLLGSVSHLRYLYHVDFNWHMDKQLWYNHAVGRVQQ
jgi:hypothetical protein